MKGVSFNNIHSYNTLNLVLAPFEIPAPTVKENYVDVPGSDCGIDLTGAFGEVKYDYLEFDLTLTAFPSDDWEAKKRQVTNRLHGLECDIVFDRNPNWRLTGRISVSERKSNKMLRQFVIHCKVAPYWLKTSDTVLSCTIGESKNLLPRLNDWFVQYDGTIVNNKFIYDDTAHINYEYSIISPSIPYNGNGVISLSADCQVPALRFHPYYYDANGQELSSTFLSLTNGKCENITVPTGCASLKIRILPKSNEVALHGEIVVKKIQLEEGAECTAFEVKNGVLIRNDYKSVMPTVTLSDDMTIQVPNRNKYVKTAGTYKLLDVVPNGESIISVDGTEGTMTVRFTERSL